MLGEATCDARLAGVKCNVRYASTSQVCVESFVNVHRAAGGGDGVHVGFDPAGHSLDLCESR